jgi:glucose-6-phosphate 1-dehydrogenase
VIERLVLFGATGDLVARFLLPALAALHAARALPDRLEVIGAAREDFDDEAFRRSAAARLDDHAADVSPDARRDLVKSLRYRRVAFDDPTTVASVVGSNAGPTAFYLALPPAVFPTAVGALGAAGMPRDSRIVIEKPFGEDLDSAVALNRLLAEVSGPTGEHALFRVDHALGLATVQNLLALRLANRALEPVWSSEHIERVDLLWEETLALEGRAGYFDSAGALKDVVQNHLLQVLSLIAMEPPASLGERDLRDRKVEALRAIRPLHRGDVGSRTRRARYTAGEIGGRTIPSYADEEGVDPQRGTETFAEVVLELQTERWAGTPFVLRGGKALARRRKEAVLRFRPSAGSPFGAEVEMPAQANELEIGLDGPEELSLHLTGGARGTQPRPVPLTLTAPPPATELPAYGRVLLDILSGGSSLSVRGDEAEEAWRVVTPVLDAWADGAVPLEEYPAGSSGPQLGSRPITARTA